MEPGIRPTNIDNARGRADLEATPERENPILRKIIVISGPSYSGKDILAEKLHERYNWPVEDGKGRFQRRTGIETGHMQRDIELHKKFDRFQARFFRKAKSQNAVVWQTRLGGIILAEERDRRARAILEFQKARQRGKTVREPGMIPAVSVLLWARKEVRVDRAYAVAMKEWERVTSGMTEGSELLIKPTKAEIEQRIDQRAKGDVGDWIPLHPDFVQEGKDPFDRRLTRQNGGLVYDYIIDTSDRNPDEVADELLRIAEDDGAIEYPVQEETIFDSEKIMGEPLPPRIAF